MLLLRIYTHSDIHSKCIPEHTEEDEAIEEKNRFAPYALLICVCVCETELSDGFSCVCVE